MRQLCYCKVNLGLQVLGTLENGYHDLDMIMMPLNFYDVLDITINDKGVTNFYSNFGGNRFANDNSVLQAIQLIKEKFDIRDTFDVTLRKSVPSQAGLGGGSGDAAGALLCLKRMYHLPISIKELMDIGVKIGADVPFCLTKQMGRVQGIGEQISSHSYRLNCYVILVKPDKGVSTKQCFQLCNNAGDAHINDELEYAVRLGDFKKTCALLNNSLEAPAMQLVPEIKQIKDEMLALGVPGVIMSGSGSTVLGLVKEKEKAYRIAKIMGHSHRFSRVTTFL